jgi:hypothetical protein
MFINGDLKAMNGNSGLQKSRSNTIAIVANINKIVEKNSDKAPHLTHSISQDGTREPLKLFPSNMSQGSLLKMANEDIQMDWSFSMSQSISTK